MKKFCIGLAVVFLLSLSSGASQAAERIRAVSGGFGSAIHAVLWAADSLHLFKKYGVNVEYIAIPSGTVGMQTMLADETQIDFSTGALAVTTNLEGADITIVAGGLNFFPYKLITLPSIHNTEELKGKRLAISRFGSATEYAADAALQKLGLTSKEVKIVQVGGNSTRFAALKTGAVQASMLIEPLATMAIDNMGMRSLIDLAATGTPFPQNCFMVRRSFLKAHHGDVVRFMKAAIDGLFILKRDKQFALRLISRYLRINKQEAAIGYDYYIKKYGDGVLSLPDPTGLQLVISQVAKRIPKAKGQTPASLKLLDPSVLRQIKESGFLKTLEH